MSERRPAHCIGAASAAQWSRSRQTNRSLCIMDTTPPAANQRTAIGIDIDRPFQRVLAVWLSARSYRVMFVSLAASLAEGGQVDLIVCELAEPKGSGAKTLGQLARAHPGAPLIAISSRFVCGAGGDALSRQLGAQAALPKPFSRGDLYAALDAVVPAPTRR
jgi:CheY-like chemotaxis protein